MVSSQPMQSGMSVREVTLLWSDQSAGDAELDGISLMDGVTHNVSIRAGWRIPFYFHLERETDSKKKTLLNNNLKTVGEVVIS